MPDDPIDGEQAPGPDLTKKLRERFEQIEEEHAPKSHQAPLVPTNDEIRAGMLSAPIEPEDDLLGYAAPQIDPNEARLLELEKELDEVTAQRQEQVGQIRSEFDERMRELDQKIQKMKEEREGKRQQEVRQYAMDASSSQGLGLGLVIAYTLIGLPLVGALLGWFLDQWLKTDLYKGLLMMVGAAGGIALTVMFLKRADSNK